VTPHELSRAAARRIAVQAQLLTSERPTDLHDVLRHLTLVQLDPTKAVAPSADLVLWSRLGSSYSPDDLRDAVNEQSVLDFEGMARPIEDIALHRAEMAALAAGGGDYWQRGRDWVEANAAFRQDILDVLRADGPLPSRALPDSCVVPWASSGWNNNRNVMMMLGQLVALGDVTVAGWEGRDRLWDLASRVYPDEVVPADEAQRLRSERRLRALGIARARAPVTPSEPNDVGEVGEPAVVEGVKGTWRVDPAYLGRAFSGRAALLSPLDRLVYDRRRALELFEFDYQLEMFKPAAKRRWGYFALPVLYGDRLVGKLDATADHKAGVLRVDALHEDVSLPRTMAAAVWREVEDLARWLDLELLVT
jgi:uncharacterized protein YcaQ